MVATTTLRKHLDLSISVADAMAVLEGSRSLLQIHLHGLRVLDEDVPCNIAVLHDCVSLKTVMPDSTGRLTTEHEAEIRVHPRDHGSSVEFVAPTCGAESLAFTLSMLFVFVPIVTGFSLEGLAIWGFIVLSCSACALVGRRKASAVHRAFALAVRRELAPYEASAMHRPFRGYVPPLVDRLRPSEIR